MKLADVFRPITPAGRVLGLALIIIAAVIFALSYQANSDAAAIGDSVDPVLMQKYQDLNGLRDLYIIIGIASLFLGLFSFMILSEKSISSSPSQSQMISEARANAQLLKGLNLSGSAVYVPVGGALTRERMFIPAPKNGTRLPTAMTDDLTFSPGKDGSTPGSLLVPIGIDLLDSCEKESSRSVTGIGLESLESELQILKFGFGLMKDFHIKERDGKMILRVEYSGLKDACKTVRTELPDTCRQMACFGCSCILTGMARASGKPVLVESVDNSTERVTFQLKIQ